MKNIRFYIYTAIVFVGVFIYMDDNGIYVDDTEESFPLLAGAFLITFGARWFLQYILKSKDKKED